MDIKKKPVLDTTHWNSLQETFGDCAPSATTTQSFIFAARSSLSHSKT